MIVACGTSWHAGLVAEYIFEELARIPVEVEYASEFRYRNPIIGPNDIVIAISQSGETADTLAAIGLAKEKGAFVFGVCNVAGSSIARATDAGAYTHAGSRDWSGLYQGIYHPNYGIESYGTQTSERKRGPIYYRFPHLFKRLWRKYLLR